MSNDAHSRPTAGPEALPCPFALNTPLNPSALSAESEPRMYQPVARLVAVSKQARTCSAVAPAGTGDTKLHSHSSGIFQYGLHSPTSTPPPNTGSVRARHLSSARRSFTRNINRQWIDTDITLTPLPTAELVISLRQRSLSPAAHRTAPFAVIQRLTFQLTTIALTPTLCH